MADAKTSTSAETPKTTDAPLVFISHDSRDAELAEAFSKLLTVVSSKMLKTFWSSDKKGKEGIEFGDEWYKRLMQKLDVASDFVCILTEQSIDRPWILYEAGVAKGKLNTPVHGLAIGVPLSRINVGPFYQFQNSDDSNDSLAKLVGQLCGRVPGMEPDAEIIKTQVSIFKGTIEQAFKSNKNPKKIENKETSDEGAVSKVLEEMKIMVRDLPMRLDQGGIDGPGRYRSRRFKHFHPMMMDEMLSRSLRHTDDPIWILIIAGVVRDDMPWLYEIALETYRTVKNGSVKDAVEALRTFRDISDLSLHGPMAEELGMHSKEMHMMFREIPMMIDHYSHKIKRLNVEKALPKK